MAPFETALLLEMEIKARSQIQRANEWIERDLHMTIRARNRDSHRLNRLSDLLVQPGASREAPNEKYGLQHRSESAIFDGIEGDEQN
jgi:hypothetical protein